MRVAQLLPVDRGGEATLWRERRRDFDDSYLLSRVNELAPGGS